MDKLAKTVSSFFATIQLAISFLTIIPLYRGEIASEREMANSLRAFPLVGGVLGLILAGVYFLTDQLHMGLGGSALAVVLWLIITGGLHGDGVMDTADGVFSGKERTKKLEIMRDSRVGAMGVMAFVSLVILKICFLASLPVHIAMWAVTIAPIVGRTVMLYAMLQFPYARTGGGLGNRFGTLNVGQKSLVAVITFMTALIFLFVMSSWQSVITGACVFVVAGVLSGAFAHWIAEILHGHTGDSYGAVCEVAETITLMTALVFWGIGNG